MVVRPPVGLARTSTLRALVVLFVLSACHAHQDVQDTYTETPDARTTADVCSAGTPASTDLRDELAALPCVASVRELASSNDGYRAFDLRFTQLVDHQDANSGTFEQQATLLVRDPSAPVVLYTTGYSDYFGQNLAEPTQLLDANQVVVEHRFFGDSIPDQPDWSQLTIANAADDHHQIIQSLRPLFPGAWITSGASKGGMATVFHRRFWPHDVDGTVAYVAPISFGAPDYRYDAYYQSVGTPECRQALEDLEVEMLTHRRTMLEERATREAQRLGYGYTRVALGPAVESAVASLYWAFWQYAGVSYCGQVPATDATDTAVWNFLQQISPVSDSDDANVAFFQAYTYQAVFQLGYPGTTDPWLDGLLLYGDADYGGTFPVGVSYPTYDPEAMQDIDQWVQSRGDRLVFVYGQWDPWTGGAFTLGDAQDSLKYVVPEGSHYASLRQLPPLEDGSTLGLLSQWTGVTPSLATSRSALPHVEEPRVPPAVLQAWRLRAAERARAGGTP